MPQPSPRVSLPPGKACNRNAPAPLRHRFRQSVRTCPLPARSPGRSTALWPVQASASARRRLARPVRRSQVLAPSSRLRQRPFLQSTPRRLRHHPARDLRKLRTGFPRRSAHLQCDQRMTCLSERYPLLRQIQMRQQDLDPDQLRRHRAARSCSTPSSLRPLRFRRPFHPSPVRAIRRACTDDGSLLSISSSVSTAGSTIVIGEFRSRSWTASAVRMNSGAAAEAGFTA